MTQIPYLDLSRARRAIEAELFARWKTIAEANAFILGPEVKQFEEAFAAFLGAAGVVGVGNGTDALVIALRALGAGPGDEVLVPAFTFFATAEAVVLVGATPVFCDIDPATFNLDPAELERRATPRTRGVVGVHLYGRPFDADAVTAFCRARGLWLLEDSAQAHGAKYRGRRVGTLGDLSAWSFYPTKNLGAFGDAGAVSGMDRDLLQKVFRLANHGQTSRYHHVEIGTNSRVDSLQAAVLNLRLARLEADNARRRALAAIYHERLAGVGDLRFPLDRAEDEPVFHQMTIATSRRDELQKFLAERGVGSSVHYPSPLHRQPAMAALLPEPPELPHTEQAAREVLCLPMFAELEPVEAEAAAAAVAAFYGA